MTHKFLSVRRVGVIAVIIIIAVASIAYWRFWVIPNQGTPESQVFLNLRPITLTLVARNGTTVTLDEKDIAEIENLESRGGFKTSVGSLRGIGNYTGVQLLTLCNMMGGIDADCSIRLTAGDGYSMVFTYRQATGQDFITFDPATGDEVPHDQPLTLVLAYHYNGNNLTDEEGPLRLAILGGEGVLTEGHWWVKGIAKVEIRPAIEDWNLTLTGAIVENMDRPTFESGVNEMCHGVNWTDTNNNVWTGIPLWLLIGRVDDNNPHTTTNYVRAFNDSLAIAGYKIKIITGTGYFREFNSTFVMRNSNIIVANRLNGAALPEPYWPLRLVGSALMVSEMISNIAEIQVIFEGG